MSGSETDLSPYIGGLVRAALHGLAGVLVTVGAIQQSQDAQFVAIGSGVVLWGAGALWSLWQKRQQAKAVKVAAAGAGQEQRPGRYPAV